MLFRQLFEPETCSFSYLLADEETRQAVLIDPVREMVDRDRQLVEDLELELVHTLETHVHADHVTGAGHLRELLGSKSVVARHGGASCGDVHVDDGDTIRFGAHTLQARTTPGHTDGCITYVLDGGTMAFTGDTLLIRGCGRTDFQSGDPRRLFHSIRDKIFSLPDQTLLYPAHDYKGRTCTSVGEEKRLNPRVKLGRTEEEFVQIMDNLKLAYPRRIDEALPANLACGLAVDGPFVPEEGIPVAEVEPKWVWDNRGTLFLVDVRDQDEYEGELGHVAGSVLAPMAQLREVAISWERNQPVVLICRSGRRSLRAGVTLLTLGFKEVASMVGGMRLWNEMGLERRSVAVREPEADPAESGENPIGCGPAAAKTGSK